MSRQYFIAGFGFINETTTNDYFIPGWGFVNETSPAGFTVIFDSVTPVEFLAATFDDTKIPDDYLYTASVTRLVPAEFSNLTRFDSLSQIEFLGATAVIYNNLSPVDYLRSILRDAISPADSGGSIRSDLLAPITWLGTLHFDGTTPIDWLSNLRCDFMVFEDSSGTLRRDTAVPLEYLTAALASSSMPEQFNSSPNNVTQVPIEYSGISVLQLDSLSPIETSKLQRGDTPTPIQTSASLANTIAAPTDFLAQQSAAFFFPIETQATILHVLSDDSVPIEYFFTIAVDGIGYVDWIGSATVLPVNYERLLQTGARRRIGYRIVREV